MHVLRWKYDQVFDDFFRTCSHSLMLIQYFKEMLLWIQTHNHRLLFQVKQKILVWNVLQLKICKNNMWACRVFSPFNRECFSSCFHHLTEQTGGAQGQTGLLASPPSLIHPSPLHPSLASSPASVITLGLDLFILSITALLFPPPHSIFHLITGRSAAVVESLVCWGVRQNLRRSRPRLCPSHSTGKQNKPCSFHCCVHHGFTVNSVSCIL